jgi:alkylation response protein AidB-like acyl-CoA dehydrogenase
MASVARPPRAPPLPDTRPDDGRRSGIAVPVAVPATPLHDDVAMEITTDAVQPLGGYGYTQDFPVERMMRDAKITQVYGGTNQVQRIVMSRQLLAGRRA